MAQTGKTPTDVLVEYKGKIEKHSEDLSASVNDLMSIASLRLSEYNSDYLLWGDVKLSIPSIKSNSDHRLATSVDFKQALINELEAVTNEYIKTFSNAISSVYMTADAQDWSGEKASMVMSEIEKDAITHTAEFEKMIAHVKFFLGHSLIFENKNVEPEEKNKFIVHELSRIIYSMKMVVNGLDRHLDMIIQNATMADKLRQS